MVHRTLSLSVKMQNKHYSKHLHLHKLFYNAADFDCILASITLVVRKIMYFEIFL